jgi:hypothetical protein
MIHRVVATLFLLTVQLEESSLAVAAFSPCCTSYFARQAAMVSSKEYEYGFGSPTTVVLSQAADSSDDDGENVLTEGIDGVRVVSDTHEELMYALGVNLARQLGDIRPLVKTGEELAQVAKGLLDTVVGRLNADGQQELLARRGKELNEIISDRA